MSVEQYERQKARIEALEEELAAEREARQRAETDAQNGWASHKREKEAREGWVDAYRAESRLKDEAIARAEQAERELERTRVVLGETELAKRQAEREREEARENERKAQAVCSTAMNTAERYKHERDEALAKNKDAAEMLLTEVAARERAEADNAELLAELQAIHQDDPYVVSASTLERLTSHPGAAMLEELRRARGHAAAWVSLCAELGVPPDANLPDVARDRLEEVRALREVRDAAQRVFDGGSWMNHKTEYVKVPDAVYQALGYALRDASRKADALKGGA